MTPVDLETFASEFFDLPTDEDRKAALLQLLFKMNLLIGIHSANRQKLVDAEMENKRLHKCIRKLQSPVEVPVCAMKSSTEPQEEVDHLI